MAVADTAATTFDGLADLTRSFALFSFATVPGVAGKLGMSLHIAGPC